VARKTENNKLNKKAPDDISSGGFTLYGKKESIPCAAKNKDTTSRATSKAPAFLLFSLELNERKLINKAMPEKSDAIPKNGSALPNANEYPAAGIPIMNPIARAQEPILLLKMVEVFSRNSVTAIL